MTHTPTREQLELAAKACNVSGRYVQDEAIQGDVHTGIWDDLFERVWNPVTSQHDSDCMACDLCIDGKHFENTFVASWSSLFFHCDHDNTIEGRRAAVRWARFLVAVEIGRSKS